ncbi:MAG TPA: YCF48-related protein [Rhodothermales bacterium]|nr:YCF48-related protein [Rhodothermales bacterium]
MLKSINIAACLLLLFVGTAAAQDAVLYAGLIKSKGYVVGSPLSASGLHRYDGDTTWTHIGWNHPRISAVAADPTDSDVLYLAAGNGVLRSRDGGESWVITTDWRVTELQGIAVDPNAPDHVYMSSAYGVWRTEDGGETWTESNEGFAEKYTQKVLVDRTQTGRLLAATDGGVYVSENGAKSWSLAGAEGSHINDIQQGESDPNNWLAATRDEGVLLSSDNGKTWRFAKGNIGKTTMHAVAIDPFDAQNMAAVGWKTGVYVSTNGGKSWKQHQKGLPIPDFYEVVFDANVPGRLWAATLEEGIFHSDDMGHSWDYAGLYGTVVFDMVFIDQTGGTP